jgi:hypothetical protein
MTASFVLLSTFVTGFTVVLTQQYTGKPLCVQPVTVGAGVKFLLIGDSVSLIKKVSLTDLSIDGWKLSRGMYRW